MNRQNTSKTMFGLVMIAVTLLLVACGGGDGDPTPTATTAANEAVPTLPPTDGTAEVLATEDISEEDITLVESDIPATAGETEEVSLSEVSSPAPGAGTPPPSGVTDATVPASAGTPEDQVTDLTGDADEPVVASTPSADVAAAGEATVSVTEASQPATAEVAGLEESDTTASTPVGESGTVAASTPDATTVEVPIATANATPEGGQFITPGDGTGGSGQPGEPSSNLPEDAPAASPVAGINVEGCEVPNVPVFEGEVTDYVTNAEVNFRSGPGTECDQILEEPLAPDQAVVVIGGPVTQTSDNTVWLQVEVDGVPGWVSEEFVEPAG